MPYSERENWLNIDSGNELLPDGTKPIQMKQCWFIISEVLWHSLERNLTVSAQATILYNESEYYNFKITTTSHKVQWVKWPI